MSKGEFLSSNLSRLHSEKARFDKNTAEWLAKVTRRDTDAPAATSVMASTLRSARSNGSSSTSRSSLFLARTAAKREVARLRIRHLQEERDLQEKELDIQQQREDDERKLKQQRERETLRLEHQREALKALHVLQEAEIERQVFEEELERGGYIPPEDLLPPETFKTAAQVTFNDKPLDRNVNSRPSTSRCLTRVNSVGRSTIEPLVDVEQTKPKLLFQDSTAQPRALTSKATNMWAETSLSPKPILELFKFDGNPTTYLQFVSVFESTIETVESDDQVKLLYLIQHCTGKAQSMIEYCLLLEPSHGFVKAKQILYETYGKRNEIARSYITNLLDGPPIKNDDSKALVDLAQRLEECNTTLEHLNYFSDLNCFQNIAKIVQKLPFAMQSQWLRFASNIERDGHEPNFSDLKRFIVNKADVAKSSYASALCQRSKRSSIPRVVSHSTLVSDQKKEANLLKCLFCHSTKHVLWKCPDFLQITVKERLQFMRQRRLCGNCGKLGHISKYCRSKAACTKVGCNQKHHVLLHRDERSNADPSKGNNSLNDHSIDSQPNVANFLGASVVSPSGKVFLNVIPVYVESGSKSVLTYAFLDQGSTTSLCADRLLDILDVTGEQTRFSLSTVSEQLVSRNGKNVSLTVRSLTGKKLFLQNMLSIRELPVDPNPALTTSEASAWPHLQDLHPPEVDGEVLLLIGVDTPEAFWVMEERRGNAGEPYAVKSTLGWSLVGPRALVNNVSESLDEPTIKINFLSASRQDLLDSQIHFLWRLDQVPTCDHNISLSKKDRYALRQMQQTKTVVKGHFQLGLPWKPGAPHLPDNYDQARVRLTQLKKRLTRNPAMKERYVKVINSYLLQGHAQLVPSEQSTCAGWYLPHHAVMHPHKAEKIRVVFDCAAKYGGCSLNDQLLRGPYFSNSLVGVLTRFRFDKIAVVGDIERMFHQVLVDPEDRRYLRFLWWPEGDLTEESRVYQMNVHLFGAASSPSCAQFSLLQSAEEQKDDFNEEVRLLIERNFYMDDCLFAAPTVDEAARLIEQVSTLLRNREFNITKWITNDKSLLQTIPEANRAKLVDIKDGDSNFSYQRVLGVLWDTTADCFRFRLNLRKVPFTRTGLLSVLSSVFDPLGFVAPLILTARLLFQDLCRRKYDWDDALLEEDVRIWRRWLDD